MSLHTKVDSVRPLNLREYKHAARHILPRMAYDYINGAAEDRRTVRANRRAFLDWRLLPLTMGGFESPDLTTTVLGQTISMPVLLAPVAMQRLAHEQGELASARAARALGTVYGLSTMATTAIEEVAVETDRWWFQLYIFRDREITVDLVQRAEAAGASALVVTVDTPKLGRRENDERNGFTLPTELHLANLAPYTQEHLDDGSGGSGLASFVGMQQEPAIHWADIEWLSSRTRLPVILKGIVAPADAREAVERGVRAIIISNHGGRQLDHCVATLDALPAVAAAVDDRAELLMDGGMRRGTDVLKALALGARAVLIGRPYVWGLTVDGESGVRHVLELLRAEIELDMLLCGCRNVAQITRDLLVRPGPLA